MFTFLWYLRVTDAERSHGTKLNQTKLVVHKTFDNLTITGMQLMSHYFYKKNMIDNFVKSLELYKTLHSPSHVIKPHLKRGQTTSRD